MPPRIDEVGGLVAARDREPARKGCSPLHENRTVRPVDVLTPRTLDEALRLKAEHPDALPIQGGTDVMVALNFDRARPAAVLNLNEVAELRGWSRENGALRLGSGPHLRRGDARRAGASCCRRSPRPRARSARRRSATAARSAATSAPPSPAGDALPPLTSRAPRSSARRCAARAALPLARVRHRREAERARSRTS